jgi:uncharacterized protein (TIGR03663 family)
LALTEKPQPAPQELQEDTLDRPLLAPFRMNWELAAYAGIILFAVVTRFWDLGTRALHHDESLHALYSWYLYVGKGYQHDPMMHGPFQFHAVALMYLLFGASDYTARVLPALFGVWVVVSPYFLRREMGRSAALIAAVLFALSPGFLYFSRFIRNDIFMAGWAMMILVGTFGYIRERKPIYFYLLAAGTALSFATKETVYITGFSFLMFFILEAIVSALRRRTPVGWAALRSVSLRTWATAIGIFLLINLLLYTTFFTNPRGVISGSTGALLYWLDQHEVQRGGQPWFYYLMLIPLYEFLPLAAAVGGAFFLALRRRLHRISYFAAFLLVWLLIGTVVYSWAGEKMPWLTLYMTQPLILLAALSLAGLFRRTSLDLFLRRKGLLAMAVAAFLAAVLIGGLVAAPPLAGTQLGMQTEQLQRAAMWLLAAAAAVSLVALAVRNGAASVVVPGAYALLAVLLVLTIRSGWEVTYNRGDIPRDMLVYVQTSPDVPRVVREIDRIAAQTGDGRRLRILLDGGYTERAVVYESIAWPFEWYLRDYTNKSYYSRTFPTPTDAPVILAMVPNQAPIRDALGDYVPQRGRLNWWYPEDYKGLSWDDVWSGLGDASVRARLWRYFLYRETLNPLGSRDFDFYVRSDLARGVSSAGPIPGVATAPVETVAQSFEGGVTILGKTAEGASVIREPRGVAIGPNGLLYVADAAGNRIVAFNPDGSTAHQWGRRGEGDGAFSEPWGLAVAPNGDVYVADTWNHRIQRFDSTGRFLGKWGSFVEVAAEVGSHPGSFWGPRDVAISPNGNVLVADTGNKRVQVFDPQGRFITAFGGEGSEPGHLREPVGLAVDPAGNVYVADTWNQRIQQFDSQYRAVAQVPVPAWASHSVVNKPYLAVGEAGIVLYSEPESHRVVVIGPSGEQLAARGALGASPTSLNNPTGVTFGPSGEILVADGRNSRVVRYQAWR